MKRFGIRTALLLVVAMLCGCTSQTPQSASGTSASAFDTSGTENSTGTEKEPATEVTDISVLALKGPTAMGMVQMMDDAENGQTGDFRYRFTIAAAVDEVAPAIAKGEADIAAVPANLASVLYNNTNGAVKVIDINTLGVLYIVENGETVSSFGDLKGKTLYASGKGATPEYSLQYLLEANGLDPEGDLSVEWKSEHAECVAALLNDPEGVAMLPQPFVTTAMLQNESLRVALDLTKEWELVQGDEEAGAAMVTGVTIVRTAFLEEHPEAVSDFLSRHAGSVKQTETDPEGTAGRIGAYGIVPEAVALKALDACNIVCISGERMQQALSGYLQVLYDANPQAVGGRLPDDAFYYMP